MFEKCEYGIIKWVPRIIRERKHFGFVCSPDGEDIFFHFGGGWLFFNGIWQHRRERNPVPGDRIFYELGRNSEGKTADPWCYAADYEDARRIDAASPNYRVVRITDFVSRENPVVICAWEGVDLNKLTQEYPRTGTTMDDFRSFQTSCFKTTHIFQVEIGPDQWRAIPDPRPLLQQTRVSELVAVA